MSKEMISISPLWTFHLYVAIYSTPYLLISAIHGTLNNNLQCTTFFWKRTFLLYITDFKERTITHQRQIPNILFNFSTFKYFIAQLFALSYDFRYGWVVDWIILSFRKPFLSFYMYLLLIWLFMLMFIFLCCFLRTERVYFKIREIATSLEALEFW
jgi:hypothetical protein